jgi:hypothetical protein
MIVLDEFTCEHVPPVDIRIDFVQGDPSPPPRVTLKMFDRSLSIESRAIDILLKTFDGIPMINNDDDDDDNRKQKTKKQLPVNVHLGNVQFTVNVGQDACCT